MKTKINTILWVTLALFVVVSPPVLAQFPDTTGPGVSPGNPSAAWPETVGSLKTSAQALLAESRRLGEENKALFNEVLKL